MNRNDRSNKGNPERQYYDKYKHALISCESSQRGIVEAGTVGVLGIGKEIKDNFTGRNDLQESWEDIKADGYGIYRGFTSRRGNCDEMVQTKYRKFIK